MIMVEKATIGASWNVCDHWRKVIQSFNGEGLPATMMEHLAGNIIEARMNRYDGIVGEYRGFVPEFKVKGTNGTYEFRWSSSK